jgi:hypothetical protein
VVELTVQTLWGRVRGIIDVAGFGRGGLGGGDEDTQDPLSRGSGPHGEMTALDKAITQLGKTRANQDAAPDDFKQAVTAVRAAWLKVLQDRAAAQADLRKILTARQEAVLVQMALLD